MEIASAVCSFWIDGCLFGVQVSDVQEVLPQQRLTRVPLAHAAVRGLINLRGQLVTAVDLRHRLRRTPKSGDDPSMMNLVLHPRHGAVSLLVDQIGDVLDLDGVAFEPPPPTLDPEMRRLIRGAYKLQDRLLLLVDTERAVALDGEQALHAG